MPHAVSCVVNAANPSISTCALCTGGDGKGKAKQILWKYFSFEESDLEQTKILCKIRHATVSATQGNTTNLLNHLKSTHRVRRDQVVKEQKN